MTDYRRRSDELNELRKGFADEDYEQTRRDFRELLALPAFRRVIVGIIKKAHVFSSISLDSVDTNATFKAIGFRELGVDIYLTANRADGKAMLKAIDERNQVERERAERVERMLGNNGTKGEN